MGVTVLTLAPVSGKAETGMVDGAVERAPTEAARDRSTALAGGAAEGAVSPVAATEPPGDLDDATLTARAADGDVAAFEALVRRHQRPLFTLAVRLLGDRTDAEDAVQESFVSAWRRLADYRRDAEFGSWMYRIVTNRCLSMMRRRRATTRLDEAVPLDGSARTTAGRAGSPEYAAEVNGRLAALHRALDGLPADLRACWVLRHVDELSYSRIAEIVGASPDAVRGRIHRARSQLAEVMRPWQ
jgi:RNA polymerase sigma-70 factor (ECF subfamily)